LLDVVAASGFSDDSRVRAEVGDIAEPDPRIEKIVGSWPGRWDTTRAAQLGLTGEKSFADVIRSYIEDEHIQPV
jgi:hypothetical protein